MENDIFFKSYYKLLNSKLNSIDDRLLYDISILIKNLEKKLGKVILVGNGGSAAIASHLSIDLTKAAGIRAVNFNEGGLLTCFSNDYGYEKWAEMALEFYADKRDLLILISSSGQSKNIINAAKKAKEMNLPIITLSGFLADNPLRSMGNINLWIDSSEYNIVESVHQIWLLSVVDYLMALLRLNE